MALKATLNGDKAKSNGKVMSTLRFEIKLDSPTDKSSNEVHYPELLKEKTQKDKGNALESFEKNEEAEIAAIAQKLEEKYGGRKRPREEDLVDLGEGYDVHDPFVDDSEAYEDFVPHEVDTFLGGFYINAGSLEYKKCEGLEDLPLKRKQKPSFKKQNSSQNAILASKKIKLAKQQIATSAQRTESMKKKLSSFAKSNPKALFPSAKTDTDKMASALTITAGDGVGGASDNNQQKIEGIKVFETPPTLPTDIPPGIEAKVKEIESMVNRTEGKLTIKARLEYDSILVKIESECKDLKMKARTTIFDYIAYVMGVTRGSLMNRIKRTIKKMKGNVTAESLLLQLKEAINEIVPAYVNKYNEDMAEYELALKAEQESKLNNMEVTTPGGGDFQLPLGGSSKPKKPRKTFRWSPKLKTLLLDVVRNKVEAELVNKNRTVSGEEVIMDFLQTVIKPLWPVGWFVKKNLYNMTQPVHCELTGYQKKVTVKKDKLSDVKSEDGSLSLPPPLVPKPLPPFEGSTQASFSSLVASVPSLKKQVVTTATATSPKDAKNFDGIFAGGSSSQAPNTANTGPGKSTVVGMATVPANIPASPKMSTTASSVPSSPLLASSSKPGLLPTKHFVGDKTKPTMTLSSSNVVPNKITTTTNTVPPSSVLVPSGKPTTSKGKAVKNMLTTVKQRGPTKITKISATPHLNLSKQEIDAIINTLKQNASLSLGSPQQLQVLLQHPPGFFAPPPLSPSQVPPPPGRSIPTSVQVSQKPSLSTKKKMADKPNVREDTFIKLTQVSTGWSGQQSSHIVTTTPTRPSMAPSQSLTSPITTVQQVTHRPPVVQETQKRKPTSNPLPVVSQPVRSVTMEVQHPLQPINNSPAASTSLTVRQYSNSGGAQAVLQSPIKSVNTNQQLMESLGGRNTRAPVISNLWNPANTGSHSIVPGSHSVVPGSHSVVPGSHSVVPGSHSVVPGSHSVVPGSHSVVPGSHSVVPGSHSVVPGSHSVVPGSHSVVPGSHSVVPGSHSVVPGSHSVVPGSHSVVPGSHSVVPGSHPTVPGSHTINMVPNHAHSAMYQSNIVPSSEHNYAPKISVYPQQASGPSTAQTPTPTTLPQTLPQTFPASFHQIPGQGYQKKD